VMGHGLMTAVWPVCFVSLSPPLFLCLSVCGPAFSQLTLEDVDSVSEYGNSSGGDAGPPRCVDVPPRPLPMNYSSWLSQFNTNPYGASHVATHVPPRVGADPVYAPPPPYNVVTAAGGAKVVLPSGCGSFAAACRSVKVPLTGRSRSGLVICRLSLT